MRRELTEEEKDFINEMKESSNIDDSIEENDKPSVLERLGFLGSPAFWAGILIIIPVVISGFILFLTYRATSYVGADSIEWLSKQPLDGSFFTLADEAGFGWLPTFLQFYSYRWIIIAGVFIVFFALAAAILYFGTGRQSRCRSTASNNDSEKIDEGERE